MLSLPDNAHTQKLTAYIFKLPSAFSCSGHTTFYTLWDILMVWTFLFSNKLLRKTVGVTIATVGSFVRKWECLEEGCKQQRCWTESNHSLQWCRQVTCSLHPLGDILQSADQSMVVTKLWYINPEHGGSFSRNACSDPSHHILSEYL